jgi:hypothetical protein
MPPGLSFLLLTKPFTVTCTLLPTAPSGSGILSKPADVKAAIISVADKTNHSHYSSYLLLAPSGSGIRPKQADARLPSFLLLTKPINSHLQLLPTASSGSGTLPKQRMSGYNLSFHVSLVHHTNSGHSIRTQVCKHVWSWHQCTLMHRCVAQQYSGTHTVA